MLTQNTVAFSPSHGPTLENNLKFSEHVVVFYSLAPSTIQLFHFNPHAVCAENMGFFIIFIFPVELKIILRQ